MMVCLCIIVMDRNRNRNTETPWWLRQYQLQQRCSRQGCDIFGLCVDDFCRLKAGHSERAVDFFPGFTILIIYFASLKNFDNVFCQITKFHNFYFETMKPLPLSEIFQSQKLTILKYKLAIYLLIFNCSVISRKKKVSVLFLASFRPLKPLVLAFTILLLLFDISEIRHSLHYLHL